MVSKKNPANTEGLNELLADAATSPNGSRAARIELLDEIHLKVRAELGRRQLRLRDALQLEPGSVVELEKLADEPVELYVKDVLLARAEVLVINECFCLRVTEVLPTSLTGNDQ